MQSTATSLKLPSTLKERIDALAGGAGQSPHAFMVAALQSFVDDAEKYQRFVRDATEADNEMIKTGRGIEFSEARAFLEARLAGKKIARPRPRAWRR
ncbi:MAG: CopG family ribbon-helix-helix protein [Burkholderiales bacterium]